MIITPEEREKLFWISAGIGGCANCLEIGDDIKMIIVRLRSLAKKLEKMRNAAS